MKPCIVLKIEHQRNPEFQGLISTYQNFYKIEKVLNLSYIYVKYVDEEK